MDDYSDVADRMPEPSDRPGNAFDRLIGNLANAGVTTWVTQVTGSPESGAAVGAMAAPIGEELSFAVRKLVGIEEQRVQTLVQSATIQSAVSAEELLELITEDAGKSELLARAIAASARSSTRLKIAILANLLVSGALADDDAVVDERLMALDAVAEVDKPHLRLLAVLMEPSPVWWPDAPTRRRLRQSWPVSRILERDPGLALAFPAVAARVQGLGMATVTHHEHQELWSITSFGRTCLKCLESHIVGVAEPGGEQ